MTRRLVLLTDEEPGDELYDRLNRLQGATEVRCDRCKHWSRFDGSVYCERLSNRPDLNGYIAPLEPDFGCASFSPLAGAEGERP